MISDHFTYSEVEHTGTGLENTVPAVYLENATNLANEVLEPLRVLLGPLVVNSWYRSPAVNAAVGGEPNSYHKEALAADIVPTGDVFAKFKMAMTLLHELPIDEIIHEQRHSQWIHVQIARPGAEPRHLALLGRPDSNGKIGYSRFEL